MRRCRTAGLFAAVIAAVGVCRIGTGQGITVTDPSVARVDVPAPSPPEPIVVGNAKQLFADDWVIERMSGLERTLHRVKKHPNNPLLTAEMPWEKPCVLLYGSVMYDPQREQDRFRMWYLCFTPRYNDDYTERLEKSGRIAYAVSRDGLHWERPNLGLHEYEGSKDNNIVIPGPWGVASVHFDPRDPDPARRYKAQVRYNGHRGYFSPDGVHFTESGRMNLSAYDRSTVHWHPLEQRWFASTKNWYKVPDEEDQRGRGYAESNDFVDWSPVTYMCGTSLESGEIVYGLEPFYYESMFFGLWDRYRREPDGLLDVQLAVSHNGRHWERPSDDAWIPLTPLPSDFSRAKSSRSPETGVDPFDPRVPWDYANNSASMLGPLRVGEELWMYYSGRSTDHRSQPHVGSIGLGTLRLDGFFSLDAGDASGELITRPLRLGDDCLRVNADASRGELRVAILDEDCRPIAPYTIEACDPITSDDVRHTITWNGSSELSEAIRGRTVRLQFELRRGELYAFWTGDEREWHTPDTTTWLSGGTVASE
ncbi:MAG: hypothetical protein R3C10_08770 [Pirellulales bacterium]